MFGYPCPAGGRDVVVTLSVSKFDAMLTGPGQATQRTLPVRGRETNTTHVFIYGTLWGQFQDLIHLWNSMGQFPDQIKTNPYYLLPKSRLILGL